MFCIVATPGSKLPLGLREKAVSFIGFSRQPHAVCIGVRPAYVNNRNIFCIIFHQVAPDVKPPVYSNAVYPFIFLKYLACPFLLGCSYVLGFIYKLLKLCNRNFVFPQRKAT